MNVLFVLIGISPIFTSMRKYIQIDLSEELHRNLKTATSKRGLSIKSALIIMIEDFIKDANKMGLPYD